VSSSIPDLASRWMLSKDDLGTSWQVKFGVEQHHVAFKRLSRVGKLPVVDGCCTEVEVKRAVAKVVLGFVVPWTKVTELPVVQLRALLGTPECVVLGNLLYSAAGEGTLGYKREGVDEDLHVEVLLVPDFGWQAGRP
jgi:hypothetical protein